MPPVNSETLYNIHDEIESRLNLTNVVGNVYLPLFSQNTKNMKR
jgi:hypothetical protein